MTLRLVSIAISESFGRGIHAQWVVRSDIIIILSLGLRDLEVLIRGKLRLWLIWRSVSHDIQQYVYTTYGWYPILNVGLSSCRKSTASKTLAAKEKERKEKRELLPKDQAEGKNLRKKSVGRLTVLYKLEQTVATMTLNLFK
ncbi:hypothetical protein ARMSODRAFT_970913 [Armillaria solidipes]|uniref:Uncharacterized protein n=1 Tax=Armillaria solidipes TaxID=1076256 RepID=A0A2H3BVM3_9AGAR|nr:hypothetical protein ARMSODRAFT_970913 [Armillaria solidipes]